MIIPDRNDQPYMLSEERVNRQQITELHTRECETKKEEIETNVLEENSRREKTLCGRRDLNPHAFWAPPPQDGVSANSTTSAGKLHLIVPRAGLEPARDLRPSGF